MDELTPEQQAKVKLVRILIGDSEGSIFYPMLSDNEIIALLELEGWNVIRAARRAGISVSLQLALVNYRERTGDIEVWNNASISYQKALNDLINDTSVNNLPAHIKPYAAGISYEDIDKYLSDPDSVRSPLSQISTCRAWWTRVDNYDRCCSRQFC